MTTTANPNICPCGSLYIPTGAKYANNGLRIRIYYNNTYVDLPLVHNADSFLSKGQSFVTSSNKIDLDESIIPTRFVIYHQRSNTIISNDIRIIIKSFNSKQILALKNFGSLYEEISFRSDLITNSFGLELENSCVENLSIN